MTGTRSIRLRRVGWLLTPVVVWAAAFFGAWLGALVGGIGTMIGGALLLTVAAVAAWLGALARLTRPGPGGSPPAPPA